jgi:hypothetical protein
VAVALLLLTVLSVLYQANGTTLSEGDAVPTENVPLALLETGKLSFDDESFPEMFKWRTHPPFEDRDDFFLMSWKDRFGDRAASDWRFSSHIEFNGPRYYIVKSPKRPEYVSTFGPIPGIVLLPVMAPFYAHDHEIASKLIARTTIGRLSAALLVATTASLLFAIADHWVSRRRALLVALTYGVGTCAWAVSSQNMWQQTVNQFFLAAAAFFFLTSVEKTIGALAAGFFFGAATACRATGAFVLVAALAHLFLHHRRSLVPLLLGAVPVPLALAAYNLHYFGSPFALAQELVGHTIAEAKTGSPDLWQTPMLVGLAGLLVSPSRGLLIFSPVLGFAFVGVSRAFREAEYRPLRPLLVGALCMMALQCKWFDWWGGHTFGYRPWLDAMPYLSLALAPGLESALASPTRRFVFATLLGWSVFVQALGAASYDRSWNLRRIFVVRVPGVEDPLSFLEEPDAIRYADAHGGRFLGPSYCDVDLWFCRKRLWSLKDNLILYQLTHFSETRARRMKAAFSEPTRWE